MLSFVNTFNYGPQPIDPEVEDLCNVMNALPGIETTSSCCGHGMHPTQIFFEVRNPVGLFFLTRCVDRRYWAYGNRWTIKLEVGDMMGEDGHLPITYLLESEDLGEDAYAQMQDLVRNMNDHLNLERFLEIFGIDVTTFDL